MPCGLVLSTDSAPILRSHWRDARLIEQFLILDSDDQQRMIKRIVADLQLDDAKFKPRAVASFINGCKDEGQRHAHLQTGRDYYNDTLIRLYAEYDARCKTQNLVDFGELLLRTFETLRNKSELLKHYQDRFSHLLIDEFQDTNTIQYAWIRLLAGTILVSWPLAMMINLFTRGVVRALRISTGMSLISRRPRPFV